MKKVLIVAFLLMGSLAFSQTVKVVGVDPNDTKKLLELKRQFDAASKAYEEAQAAFERGKDKIRAKLAGKGIAVDVEKYHDFGWHELTDYSEFSADYKFLVSGMQRDHWTRGSMIPN